jgi:L-aspartate oxidase
MKYYDFVIIGSGIAGLYTALIAKDIGSVLILTKGSIEDCNTKYAQGGIAAPVGNNDSPELHFQDTIAAGNGLCNQEAVRILTNEASERIADLIKYGVPFDTVDGAVALTREAAHSVSRILHAGGDATGQHIEITLSERVRQSRIEVLEHCLATRIDTDNKVVQGIETLDCQTGITTRYRCKFVILATGGAGKLFKYTTNSDVATGDGNALAYQTGAEIVDMEFFQFHPTAVRIPGVPPFLISEAVRGEGGILRDTNNYRFMVDYTEDADLAPRDIASRSILAQMKKTQSDCVFIDVTHIPPHVITTRFPQIYRFCLDHGLDITRDYIPVAPAAHYFMGGVKVNIWGETNINGLFAVGETACTGVHGANRLASNSLLEVVVFSKRIIDRTKDIINEVPMTDVSPSTDIEYHTIPRRSTSHNTPEFNLLNIQSLLWDNLGIIRSGSGLLKAIDILHSWHHVLPKPTDRFSYELNSMVLNAILMAEAALLREESRGAHYRTDYPDTSPDWQKHIVFHV